MQDVERTMLNLHIVFLHTRHYPVIIKYYEKQFIKFFLSCTALNKLNIINM